MVTPQPAQSSRRDTGAGRKAGGNILQVKKYLKYFSRRLTHSMLNPILRGNVAWQGV
jgi:hypothetical protein